MHRFVRLTPLAVTLMIAAACAPQVDAAAEEAALRARSEALTASEVQKNADQAITFWADDAFVQPSGAPAASGKQAIRALYGQFFDDTTFKSFASTPTRLVVAASGDLAYEHGTNRMVFATPAGEMADIGKYLAIWQKVNGEWMVTGLAFSSDAPPPPMPAVASKAPSKAPAKKPM